MSAWGLKLGVIVPSWNTVMEYEFKRMAGEATSLHAQRIRHTADTEENVKWLSTQAPEAAELLSHAKVNAICFGCTGSGFLKTPDEDREFAVDLQKRTGISTTTSSASIVAALRKMKAKKISVASPYEPWMNEKLREYLVADGFEVVAMKGLGTQAHGSVQPETVKALAHGSRPPGHRGGVHQLLELPHARHHRGGGEGKRQAGGHQQPGGDVGNPARHRRQTRRSWRRTPVQGSLGGTMRLASHAIAMSLLLSSAVQAQDYPNKAVRIVIPFPAGGGTDILSRALGQKLSEKWKQPVIVDNRPGGGANIGADHAAKSAPDGYTLFMSSTIHSINVSLYPKLSYDFLQGLRADRAGRARPPRCWWCTPRCRRTT